MAVSARVAAVVATAAMICPGSAAADVSVSSPSGLPLPAPSGTSEVPLQTVSVTGSPAGVAWEVQGRYGGGDDDHVVHYTAFSGGPSDVVAGPAMTAESAGVSAPDYSLVGSQLYLPEPTGVYGLDIDTGAQLPTRHACWWRTGASCFTVERVGPDSHFQLRLTDDASGTSMIYQPPPIEGISTPQDSIYPLAVDGYGAIIQAHGSRELQPGADPSVLVYLDFDTGTYTTLDDTSYAASDRAAMDATHLVWTHDGQVVFVGRTDLTSAPKSATPDTRVTDIALSGDTLAYVGRNDREPGRVGVQVVHTGPLGARRFSTTQLPGTLYGLVPVDNGDFAVASGNSAPDYGIYRLTPGAAQAGPLITLFGFAPLYGHADPGADLNADGRSALATTSRGGTWSIHGNRSIHLGGPGAVPVVIDNSAAVARPAVFRPSTGRWSIRSTDGDVHRVTFGHAGDVPVPAHYAGPYEAAVLATFRPTSAEWHIRGRPSFTYGHPGDIPVPGHYFGGFDHAAVFRPDNGSWCVRGHGCVLYGRKGDVPVPADYDGDGRTDFAVYRTSNHTWHVRGHATVRYGRDGDIPVLGDFDGDGRADIAVYRTATHTWHIRGVGVFTFGRHHARPVEAAP